MMEAEWQRMEKMFQWMQSLSESMGQPPPPELFPPPPPPATTPVSLPFLPWALYLPCLLLLSVLFLYDLYLPRLAIGKLIGLSLSCKTYLCWGQVRTHYKNLKSISLVHCGLTSKFFHQNNVFRSASSSFHLSLWSMNVLVCMFLP
jgi:hypothetical protein